MMIRNVMVRLDGTRADDARPAVSDKLEAELRQRLARLQKPVELRWCEAFGDTMGEIVACETRTADRFVAMRPVGSSQEPEHLVECVLFGMELHSAVKRFPPAGSCRC
jgi:hypothetical protein